MLYFSVDLNQEDEKVADDDKLVLNSAIQDLIHDPFDSEAAKIIILFGDKLPPSSPLIIIEGQIRRETYTTLTGPQEETTEFSYGLRAERVGLWRVWKERRGLICFQYFWNAGLSDKEVSGSTTVYGVFYKPASLEYLDLKEMIEMPLLSFWFLAITSPKWRSLKDGKETHEKHFLIRFQYR